MHIRVRDPSRPGSTCVVRIEGSTTYQNVIATVERKIASSWAWQGEPGGLRLSLNKKDPLDLDLGSKISGAGIKAGDLLYVLSQGGDGMASKPAAATAAAAAAAAPSPAAEESAPVLDRGWYPGAPHRPGQAPLGGFSYSVPGSGSFVPQQQHPTGQQLQGACPHFNC